MIYENFNTEEKALFNNVLPESKYQYKDSQIDDLKVWKVRLSLLFCSNTTGLENLKPIVIGHSLNPRLFKTINKGIKQEIFAKEIIII